MWKHNSKAGNSIGDYDYYLYDEPYKNPLKFETETVIRPEETSEDTAAADMIDDEQKKANDKEEYKRMLFSQLTRKQVLNLYENYKVDFEMFGYDIDEFLSFAKI